MVQRSECELDLKQCEQIAYTHTHTLLHSDAVLFLSVVVKRSAMVLTLNDEFYVSSSFLFTCSSFGLLLW